MKLRVRIETLHEAMKLKSFGDNEGDILPLSWWTRVLTILLIYLYFVNLYRTDTEHVLCILIVF